MRDGPTTASADGAVSPSVNPADDRRGELRRLDNRAGVCTVPDAAACEGKADCDTDEAPVDDGATAAEALCGPFAGRLALLVAVGGATTAAAATAELAVWLKLTMNSPSSAIMPAIRPLLKHLNLNE